MHIVHTGSCNKKTGSTIWKKGHPVTVQPARWGPRSGVVQVTRTSLPLVLGPTNGHLSQSHDSRPSHCQSCNEICMKQGCLAAAGPVLINDSIHWRPTWNTFIIHYLFMQSILCILIPPPAVLHWNEAKLKLCLKFKVVPLPRATCPLTVMHTRLLESETFSSLALLALQASVGTIALEQPVFPPTTANIFVAQSNVN